MDDVQVHSECIPHLPVCFVPGEHFVRGNMIGFPNCFRIAEQTKKTPSEICIPGEYPQRSAVARDDNRQAALHAVDDGIGVLPTIYVQRQLGGAIGQ